MRTLYLTASGIDRMNVSSGSEGEDVASGGGSDSEFDEDGFP